MQRKEIVILVISLILVVAVYYGYQYLKEKPPLFLIEFLTKTEPPPPLPEGDSAPLEVPDGFHAFIFARNVPGVRVMTRDPRGVMLVSETQEGKVIALPDEDNDGRADPAVTVLEGLNLPHGILVTCASDTDCTLYVAETNALKTYAYDPAQRTAQYRETIAEFPSGEGHFTRTLLMHPDGKHLLVSIGSSCNVCNETEPSRASVQSIDLATKEMKPFATGLRNSVFLALHPVSGEVWATENGRDVIGDDIPPDEINIIKEGKNYGWPVCYGNNVHDTDFDDATTDPCGDKTPAEIELQAHSAALGLGFVPEEGWPEDWWHDLIVAFHGSWNRSEPTGYKVVRIDLDENGDIQKGGIGDFVTGFLGTGQEEDAAIGRPVGIMVEPGGVVYVSDDRAGAIYRIVRESQE